MRWIMFVNFFLELRQAKVPVTLREYLTLLEGLDLDLADKRVEDFYYLSRACLVKDERHLDRFDRVFAKYAHGIETSLDDLQTAITALRARPELRPRGRGSRLGGKGGPAGAVPCRRRTG